MNVYQLPYFGEINLSELNDYYDIETKLDNQEVELDINFDEETVDTKRLDLLKKFLENLPSHINAASNYIQQGYKSNDEDVTLYIEHHMSEVANVLDGTDELLPVEERFLSKMKLVRVGFYPEDDDTFAVFDFTIGRDITDYLIVVNLNHKGKLEYIAMES